MKEYWVLVSSDEEAQWGLLNRVSRIKSPDGMTAALLLEDIPEEKAFAWGADKVYLLGSGDAGQTGRQIARLAAREKPWVIAASADTFGRTVAATVAALLETGLGADCTALEEREDGLLLMTRPTFGQSLMAKIICPSHRPQIATVRPGTYLPEKKREGCKGEIIRVEDFFQPSVVQLLERQPGMDKLLSFARIIVAGGRGIGSREGFELLGQLASAMGASLGASREAVSAGYAAYHRQIGLTGQTVGPDVYIAFGISGAVQHLAGMEKSSVVIAVNSDEKAPIFEYADYGIVGDWERAAQAMLKRCKET